MPKTINPEAEKIDQKSEIMKTHGTLSCTDMPSDVIFAYTREDALSDGVLVDLGEYGSKEIYKHPVACTSAVWSLIEQAVNNEKYCNDFNGVVWDLNESIKK